MGSPVQNQCFHVCGKPLFLVGSDLITQWGCAVRDMIKLMLILYNCPLWTLECFYFLFSPSPPKLTNPSTGSRINMTRDIPYVMVWDGISLLCIDLKDFPISLYVERAGWGDFSLSALILIWSAKIVALYLGGLSREMERDWNWTRWVVK